MDRRFRSRTRRCASHESARATCAGTTVFIAQVTSGSPADPNLRPARKRTFSTRGSALRLSGSRRSQAMVSTPAPAVCVLLLRTEIWRRRSPATYGLRCAGRGVASRPAWAPSFPRHPGPWCLREACGQRLYLSRSVASTDHRVAVRRRIGSWKRYGSQVSKCERESEIGTEHMPWPVPVKQSHSAQSRSQHAA